MREGRGESGPDWKGEGEGRVDQRISRLAVVVYPSVVEIPLLVEDGEDRIEKGLFCVV